MQIYCLPYQNIPLFADIGHLGFSYVIVDENKLRDSGFFKPFKELSVGLEIFNIFDVQNSITNTFVRDAYTKVQYAIPNYLTPRVFNVRTTMKF